MTPIRKKQLITIIVLAALLAIGFIAYNIWQNSKFRVSSTTPSLSGTVATSTSVIKLDFNRDLKDDEPYDMTIIGEESTFVREVVRDGKSSLKLRLRQLDKNTRYTLVLTKVTAADGSVLEDVRFSFVVDYIPHNKLSKAQQKLELEETDIDNFTDPILEHIPHSTLSYTINPLYTNSVSDDGEHPEDSGSDHSYILTLDIKIILSNADMDTVDESIEIYKKQALDYIREKGFDPNNYDIKYTVLRP